ncbi:MAG: PQQ-dependent catabolism-associated beta-propeller protein [Candidatus Eutrophobiaceae bacterium]
MFLLVSIVSCGDNADEQPAVIAPEEVEQASSPQAAATITGRIFVTNEKGNTVSVINGETLEVEAEIPIGNRPRGIGISPDGLEVYVAVSEENKIVVFDPRSLEILREFQSGSDPETFAVHPNGNIYISNEDDAKASVYDPRTGVEIIEIPVGLEPEGVAISPDGSKVIVTSESTNMLHVIKVPEHIIIGNVLVGARPRSAVFSADGSMAWSTSEISGEVKRVDMESYQVVKQARLPDDGAKPKDILLSRDQKHVYVAGGRSNSIIVMDAESLDVIESIPVGKRVWGLAMNRSGDRLFTTDGVSGTVSVIDTTRNVNIKTIKVGAFPWGVVVHD